MLQRKRNFFVSSWIGFKSTLKVNPQLSKIQKLRKKPPYRFYRRYYVYLEFISFDWGELEKGRICLRRRDYIYARYVNNQSIESGVGMVGPINTCTCVVVFGCSFMFTMACMCPYLCLLFCKITIIISKAYWRAAFFQVCIDTIIRIPFLRAIY